MRATLYLPDTIYQRLELAAKREQTSLSRLASDLLDRALAKRDQGRVEHTHAVLQELNGIGGAGDQDASTTIDRLLYEEERGGRGEQVASADR